ncbi:hypothetical protein BKA70DRAFT_784694 [Coprinopsis sp. MPI-PUGE-AT-0042]|nr:hypothetical protein BKA70DRAFT_784694 [Coprinopsis sp. MPI-PUGE-AT-0042]
MRSFQTSHDRRVFAFTFQLHLHHAILTPTGRRMHRTTALGLEALQKVLWWTCTLSAGNLGLFVPLQHSGHRDPAESFSRRHHRLWISYLSFFYPSKSISDSRKENGFVLATLYFTIPGLVTNATSQPKQRLYLPSSFHHQSIAFRGSQFLALVHLCNSCRPAILARRSLDRATRVPLSSASTPPSGRGYTDDEVSCRAFSPLS